jgi:hypothetical protein
MLRKIAEQIATKKSKTKKLQFITIKYIRTETRAQKERKKTKGKS